MPKTYHLKEKYLFEINGEKCHLDVLPKQENMLPDGYYVLADKKTGGFIHPKTQECLDISIPRVLFRGGDLEVLQEYHRKYITEGLIIIALGELPSETILDHFKSNVEVVDI